jgi:hypothetical protein
MKTKKGLVIMILALAIIAIGLLVSTFINWPVDRSSASGNIAKASRFSRQTATDKLSIMEELILNDENYKNSVVLSYVTMQMRANQFGSLVDISNEAAGEIPEFAVVLGKMNEVRQMAENVSASLQKAGESLEAILSGESRPEMGQQTNDAALAYLTLQKQNKLATEFIDTADKYLVTHEGTDQLKLVRDQWVGYQMMTASLEGDSNLEKEMADKEILLSVAESSAALSGFKTNNVPIMEMTGMASFTGLGIITLRYNDKAYATLLNMPQISQSFNGVVLGIREVGGTGEAINISDNMFANQIGVMIQSIADGNVESLNAVSNSLQ